jgi:hypothetical protein
MHSSRICDGLSFFIDPQSIVAGATDYQFKTIDVNGTPRRAQGAESHLVGDGTEDQTVSRTSVTLSARTCGTGAPVSQFPDRLAQGAFQREHETQ